MIFVHSTSGLFFGHCEKNSSSEKLKTQAKSRKNSSKIRKKLKNRQLQLSSDGGFFLQTSFWKPSSKVREEGQTYSKVLNNNDLNDLSTPRVI